MSSLLEAGRQGPHPWAVSSRPHRAGPPLTHPVTWEEGHSNDSPQHITLATTLLPSVSHVLQGPGLGHQRGTRGTAQLGQDQQQVHLQSLLTPRFPPSLGDPGDLPPSVPTHPHLGDGRPASGKTAQELRQEAQEGGKKPRKAARCISRCAHGRQSMFSPVTGQTCPSKGSEGTAGAHGLH